MRSLYADEISRFIDPVDPVEIASEVKYDNPAMRSFLPLLFQSMAIDSHAQLKAAWSAIFLHPAYPRQHRSVVTASDVDDPQLKLWLEKFDALPMVPTPEGPRSLGEADQLESLRDGWLRGGWINDGLWPDQSEPSEALRQLFTPFFKENYQWIVDQSLKNTQA